LCIGQTGRTITIRQHEHTRYIRNNKPISGYALHILNNKHEYGSPQHTIHLMHECNKGKLMNCWESLYMQKVQQLDLLIDKQKIHKPNLLYKLGNKKSARWLTVHTE
jgi:hypothetical protein